MKSNVITREEKEKLNKIINEYPITFEWMKHKARWEQRSLSAILSDYEDYIDELMNKEQENA